MEKKKEVELIVQLEILIKNSKYNKDYSNSETRQMVERAREIISRSLNL